MTQPAREFREIPIGLIDEPALPSRADMDETKMDELIASIRQNGLIQPIAVFKAGDRYEVIAGHRRRLASARAGLAVIPCVVYPSKSREATAIQFIENRHREDLNPADEALWFDELLERDCGGDVDKLCALLGERRAYVEGRLILFAGDPEVFAALKQGKIKIGHAQQLNRCDNRDHRRMLLHQAITGGATVAVLAGWIAEYERVHKPALTNSPDAAPIAPIAPVMVSNFFTCKLCGKDDNVHAMQPVNFHTYCEAAMFADMLALYQRRHEFLRIPRTVDEASALIAELADRFPEIGAA